MNENVMIVMNTKVDIKSLKNIHEGKRCFLIGNGPSLYVQDLDKLKGELTFACNRIYLLFSDTDWRPTYYTISDPLFAQAYRGDINNNRTFKIFSDSVRPYFKDATDIVWLEQLQYTRDDDLSDFAFSTDLARGVCHGASTLYIQMQIAFYMGIKQIYLIGADFNYKIQTKGIRSGMGYIVNDSGEKNHFHPNYRQSAERWWLADTDFQLKTYSFANEIFIQNKRQIYNASRKSALNVFPRVDLDSCFF